LEELKIEEAPVVPQAGIVEEEIKQE